MSYLMSISIGPVQDFIASARRSRDLWFGSWLLSELSKTAAHVIVNEYKKENLIFPAVEDPNDLAENSDFNVVNKIVALVEKAGEVGDLIYTTMQKRLTDIREGAYKKIKDYPKYNPDIFYEQTAINQVNDLIEFFWIAVKISDPEDAIQYQKARQKLEYLFMARKATRNFASTKLWSANVPKSSLDGQRESVIDDNVFNSWTKEQLRLQFGVREGERLCGIGLLKRNGNRKSRTHSTNDDSFFSTSHVASLPLLEILSDKTKVDKYIECLKELGLKDGDFNKVPIAKGVTEHAAFRRHDGHILFEERLIDYFNPNTQKNELNKAKNALREFLVDALNGKKPLPYYALLLADGDAMGKAIDARTTKKDHRELSTELSAFAKEVREVVEITYKGSLIYSGGDDVLAFLPLHTVLECAEELESLFAQKLRRFEITAQGKTYSPTLSVGIAVAHHLEPLEDTLELARKAEKAAKAITGKNALAIIVDKRSGTSRMLKGHWKTIDRRLHQFITLHMREEISDGAAYQLRDLANRLDVSEGKADKATLDKIKLVEARRILKRKKVDKGQKEIEQQTLDVLFESLQIGINVETLADELIIAKIFADAKNLAGEKR